VDLEEYFQVNGFERWVPRNSWDSIESRLVVGTKRLLDLLARHDARATFFVLGWVAERHADLVRRIAAAGHEIASHGHEHQRITTLSPVAHRADVRRSKAVLEDCTGQAVAGFRAPSFSITPRTAWALEVLVEEGYRYDSSLFPIRRPGYGFPGAHSAPHVLETPSGPLAELPLATTTLAGVRLPAAGGGYLRQLPVGLMRRALREHAARGLSAMCYIHPWELDPDQPRLGVPWLTRVRHYRNLRRVEPLLDSLMTAYPFVSVRDRYGDFSEQLITGEWPVVPVHASDAAAVPA
jgi:polysaccharide deacetylase family protein (PEP-CTERM system associated)